MIASKELEKIEHSAVKLTVTLEQQALKDEYNDLLNQYAKSAHIKGFRKGKAPASVLERKFGEGIKQEAVANSIEKALKEIYEEVDEKPLPYATPKLEDEELNPDLEQDFTFTVTYDTFPEVTLGNYKGLKITEPVVELTEEDEKRELEMLQEQNAIVVDKADAVVAKDDIVTIDYAELDDEGSIVEGSNREGFVFTVGSGYNLHKIDDDVIGMKKEETKVFDKEYGDDFEVESLKGKKLKLQVTVTAVKTKDIPELDDELAQDISEDYETLEDLKKDIREKLQQAVEQKVREKKISQIIDQIVENSSIDLPESMVQSELDSSWQQFLMRSRIPEDQADQILAAQGTDREALRTEWRPSAEKRLKSRLLLSKIIEEEKIELADNDIEETLEKQAAQNNMEVEVLREQYESGNYMHLLEDEIKDKKTFDFIMEQADMEKGDKVKFLDFMQDKE